MLGFYKFIHAITGKWWKKYEDCVDLSKEWNIYIKFVDKSIEINPYDDLMYESKGDCYKALENMMKHWNSI